MPFLHQCHPEGDAERIVHRQDHDRHAPNGRPPDQLWAGPAEMTVPFVPAWVEEWHKSCPPPTPFNTGDVRPLVPVAVQTRVGQITQDRLAPVLFRNDVLDFKRGALNSRRQPAILAGVAGASANVAVEPFIHDGPCRSFAAGVSFALSIAVGPGGRPP